MKMLPKRKTEAPALSRQTSAGTNNLLSYKDELSKSIVPNNIIKPFLVPAEVFALLDPLEKIVIRRQADRGEVIIGGQRV